MPVASEHPHFFTATCLEWKHLLSDDAIKEVILESMRFLVKHERVSIFAFCIMNNHIHIIWQMLGDNKREDVQRDFLKFTSQQILRIFKENNSPHLKGLFVGAKDRKYQFWERNALSISLESHRFFEQKFDYIHMNPVQASLCRYPWEYRYSSADFYYNGGNDLGFLEAV